MLNRAGAKIAGDNGGLLDLGAQRKAGVGQV
jgi:hypothetical protein